MFPSSLIPCRFVRSSLFRITSPSFFSPLSFRTFSSQNQSDNQFIRNVMEQMKREMEKNAEFREAMNNLKKENAKLNERTAFTDAINALKDANKKMSETFQGVSSKMSETSEKLSQNEHMQGAFSQISKVGGVVGQGFGKVFEVVKSVSSKLSIEEDEAKRRSEEFKLRMAERRQKMEEEAARQQSADSTISEEKTDNSEPQEEVMTESEINAKQHNDLVLVEESAWDRFGHRLRDMPFLSKFYDGSLTTGLFQETQMAKALRVQKEIDPSFRLHEFSDQVEHVICGRILEAYLMEDENFMNAHVTSCALESWKSSIRERRVTKVTFEPVVLHLSDVTMKSGYISDDPEAENKPIFLWTFTAQQINCLRDSKGKIVQGAIDDIREVYYAMALRKHSNIDQPDVEFPWELVEFAMLGSRPVVV